MDRSDHRLHRHSPADGIRNDLLCRNMLNKAKALLSIMPGRASCDGRKELFLVLAKTYGGCCRVSGSVYPFINDIGGTLVG